MNAVLKTWYVRYFSDPQAVILTLLLVVGVLVVHLTGYMFAPVIAGVVIAYLLEGLVNRLMLLRCPHGIAVGLVYALFVGALVVGMFLLLPRLLSQLTNLFAEFPLMMNRGHALLTALPASYPDYITVEQIDSLLAQLKSGAGKFGQALLSFSLASIPGLMTTVVYLVLVPLLVFFFLWDEAKILAWVKGILPKRRQFLSRIWVEVNHQLGNYVRGKVLEIFIVAIMTYIAFALMGLPYAMLLAVLVGLSVIIPFVGVVVVTVPVVIIAFVQWGWSGDFAYLLLVYTLIGIFDANVIVPILFAEAVNLHPVAIIVAILFFGGVWGFWGVFFAIPLAVVVQALIMSWPKNG